MDLSQYGPWAIAFSLLLLVFKEVVMQALKRDQQHPGGGAFTELARALEKLSSVLDRIEKAQDKALTEILTYEREAVQILTEIRAVQQKGGQNL